jgi:hypothetical protein
MMLPFIKGYENIRFDFVVIVVGFCSFNDVTNVALATGGHIEQEV